MGTASESDMVLASGVGCGVVRAFKAVCSSTARQPTRRARWWLMTVLLEAGLAETVRSLSLCWLDCVLEPLR